MLNSCMPCHLTKSTSRQAHLTLGLVEKHSDGQFVLKALKQKLYVDGLCYLLQVEDIKLCCSDKLFHQKVKLCILPLLHISF